LKYEDNGNELLVDVTVWNSLYLDPKIASTLNLVGLNIFLFPLTTLDDQLQSAVITFVENSFLFWFR
jgi:hypothetical protein